MRRGLCVQMWQGRGQSRCRCGGGEPSPGADVGGVSPVPVQMWAGRAQSRRRWGAARHCGHCRVLYFGTQSNTLDGKLRASQMYLA